ncbi:hypothetical protein [Streptomyces sp. CB01881]|uniref:hypothetical protein n=1 Tax=Streptomyces sp. CB01881 TaxID=2078691 RepID=UPI000CDC8789|nr:hypothetical protein [Streptomyces sp. CB01881]AUY48342.1 hypothetical protein C2142_04515 [Streptomyces sp. CB01881]TYC76828.1 hypothetical protein EH183_04525 [Streptomyces sp. CB01881]
MATAPDRHWHTREIAAALNTVKENTLTIHLSAWARKNLLVKTAPATYALPEDAPADARTSQPNAANSPIYALI